MNYLVVIDTNVLISALLSKHNDAATVRVLNAVFDGKIIPVFNEEILSEYDNVLHRPKFKFPDRGFLLKNSGREQKTHGRLFCTYEIVYNPRTFDRNSLRSAATANARTAVMIIRIALGKLSSTDDLFFRWSLFIKPVE